MPIPGLTVKNRSAQSWRRQSGYRRRRLASPSWRRSQPTARLSRRPGILSRWRKPSLPVAKLAKGLLLLAVVGIGVLGIASLVVLGSVAKDPPNPNRIIDRTVAQSTKIYDRTGETLLYDVHGAEKRTIVKLEDIPEYVKQATITAEDRKFYEQQGRRLDPHPAAGQKRHPLARKNLHPQDQGNHSLLPDRKPVHQRRDP